MRVQLRIAVSSTGIEERARRCVSRRTEIRYKTKHVDSPFLRMILREFFLIDEMQFARAKQIVGIREKLVLICSVDLSHALQNRRQLCRFSGSDRHFRVFLGLIKSRITFLMAPLHLAFNPFGNDLLKTNKAKQCIYLFIILIFF